MNDLLKQLHDFVNLHVACDFEFFVGNAWMDITAYYVAWFKTGNPPKITNDAIYYFHRVHTNNVNVSGDVEKNNSCSACPTKADFIEIVIFHLSLFLIVSVGIFERTRSSCDHN